MYCFSVSMMLTSATTILSYANEASALDLLGAWFILTKASEVMFMGKYVVVKRSVRLPLVNARNFAV